MELSRSLYFFQSLTFRNVARQNMQGPPLFSYFFFKFFFFCFGITKTRLFKYIEKKSPPKAEKFQMKEPDFFFHISSQNIGGSNEYPQSMFLSRHKKNIVYPCKPRFYYIKVGFKGVKII